MVWAGGCESGGLRCRQLKPACARPSSAVRSRLLPTPLTPGALAHVRAEPRSPRVHSLTNPPVLTAIILSSAPKLPGCKRLHLTFSPSWAAKSAGQAKTQILSTSEPPPQSRPSLTPRTPPDAHRPDPLVPNAPPATFAWSRHFATLTSLASPNISKVGHSWEITSGSASPD